MDANTELPLLRYSISCTNIPEALLNKVVAKQHFTQFGKVATMYVRPQQMSCTIDYVDKESAEDAIEYGGEYDGVLFDIDWAKNKKRQAKVFDPDWLPDAEVQSELDALEALVPASSRLSRQQPMIIDLTGPDIPVKKTAKKTVLRPKKLSSKPQKINNDSETKNIPVKSADFEHLREVLATPAFTAEQRYRALDARDQLIRLQNAHETNVKTEHTKGVCPDMCPEKERLMREFQHQIAQYEQDVNDSRSMNHSLAVKQYSRSSADQETSLPHELRPVPVLEKTMNYLLQKIVCLSEEDNVNLNDWYHFIWDRMRSIRKDITQQELCCKGSVKLVEQCARFHIHCAARLVDEDASVFDQRINTENLTKCLQSLKYMYHDLGQKNETCPNEPEFRAYIILLNLNDCNFMWEVQRWNTAVQESPQVKFAIQFFLALDSNNYVKFFKLLKSTTYLNACILLRYFNQVRSRAIGTIMKSYIARIPTYFPLDDLTNILGFENNDQCAQFMEHYGLNCNYQENTVFLDKQMFMEPEYTYRLTRCLIVIESKKICSVGEAIYGGPMPVTDFTTYTPHNSFDEEGYLTALAMNAEDQHYLTAGDRKSPLPRSVIKSNMFGQINPAPDVQKPTEILSNKELLKVKGGFGNQLRNNITPKSVFTSTNNIFSRTVTPKDSVESKNIFSNSKTRSSNIFTKINESHNIFSSAVSDVFKNAQAKPTNIFVGNANSNVFSNAHSKTNTTQPEIINNPFSAQTTNIFAPKSDLASINDSKSIFGFKSTVTPAVKNNIFAFGNTSTMSSSSTLPNQKPVLSPVKNQPTSPGGFSFSLPANSNTKIISELAKTIPVLSQEDEVKKEMQRKQELAKLEAEKLEKKRKEEEEQRKRQETIEICTKQASLLCDDIFNEEIQKICKSIAENELKNYTRLINCANETTDNLLSEIMDEIIRYEIEYELHIYRELENIHAKSLQRLAQKYFDLWLQNVLIKKLKQKAIEETPVWIPARSVEEEALLLYRPNQDLALENILNYRQSCLNILSLDDERVKKIDIFGIVYENVITSCQFPKPRSKAYWKLVISLPDEIESSYWAKYVNNWINNSFQDTLDLNDSDQLILNEYVDTRYSASLSLSFRKIVGCQDCFEDMLGTNGLIFFVLDTEFSTSRMRDRLMKILEYREKPKVSLAIIYLNINKRASKDDKFDLNLLVEAGLVENYNIISSEDYSIQSIHKLVTEAMEWLSKQYEPDPPLEMDTFESFTHNCLGSVLIHRFSIATLHNYILRKSFKNPNFIIELYNAAVEKCLEMLSDESLPTYKDFAPELKQFLPKPLHTAVSYEYFPTDWRNVKVQCQAKSFVKNFEISYIDGLQNINDFDGLKSLLLNYCSKVFSRDRHEKVAAKMFGVIIRSINSVVNFNKQFDNVSWGDVIDVLVRELVTERLSRVLSKNSNLYVIYNKNSLVEYLEKPWWLKSKQFKVRNKATHENFNMIQEEDAFRKKRQRLSTAKSTSNDFDTSISRALQTLDSFDDLLSKQKDLRKSDVKFKYDKLSLTLQEHANKSYAFNKILDKTVSNFH